MSESSQGESVSSTGWGSAIKQNSKLAAHKWLLALFSNGEITYLTNHSCKHVKDLIALLLAAIVLKHVLKTSGYLLGP